MSRRTRSNRRRRARHRRAERQARRTRARHISTAELAAHYEANEYDEFADDPACAWCGGDGFVPDDEMGDPLWYDENEFYPCSSCGGSGLAKDMTCW